MNTRKRFKISPKRSKENFRFRLVLSISSRQTDRQTDRRTNRHIKLRYKVGAHLPIKSYIINYFFQYGFETDKYPLD